MGEEVVAADGQQIINFANEYDGGFYKELIAKVNRSDALEAALIAVIEMTDPAINTLVRAKVNEILVGLGLSDHVFRSPRS